MSIVTVLVLAGAVAAPALCQKMLPGGKPDLNGRWDLQKKNGQAFTGAARVIEQTDDKIRIRTVESGKTDAIELECGTRGQECGATLHGDNAKVTLWYNGNTLVEMARFGKDEVVETRRAISEDGKTLTITVTPLAPAPRDPEIYVFTRAPEGEPRASTAPPSK